MSQIDTELDTVSVRLAETQAEVEAAQALRYKVFYEEYDALPNAEMIAQKRDFDEYDAYADHLIVVDSSGASDKIVGTYRMLQRSGADQVGQFYSSSEYDLSPF